MKKNVIRLCSALLLAALCLALCTGCTNNTRKLLDGRWQLDSTGNSKQENMVEPHINMYVDIFANGHVTMYGSDLGEYTIDRNRFEFNSYDGKYHYSGSFSLQYPNLYIYLDDADVCAFFYKTAEHNADGTLKEEN